MAEKNIKSRIVHKHDVESNWLLATNFVPKQGEIIVYDKDESYNYERFKIGDGITLVSALPFATDAVLENIFPADPQVGQVLSINADGNKTWTNQYVMDGTLTPGYQKETLWHVFVIDITNNTPEIGTYYFTSGNVQIRIVKDGAVIAKTVVNGAKEIQITSIIPSGTRSGVIIWVTTHNNKQKLDCYFEDNSNVVSGDLLANKWYISTIQYSSNEVDNLLKNKLDSPTNAGTAGQVLSIDADGNKMWANPYAIDGTLTPGYQYNSATNSHLFVIDATNNTPALGTYYFNSGTVYIKVVKDGVKVSQESFAAVKQIQVININPSGEKSGIMFDIIYVDTKQRVNLYFEDNVYVIGGTYTANTFYKTTLQYSSKEVDNLLNQKLDSPTNTGTTGQVPVYQQDGSTAWGDMPVQIQADWNQNDSTAADYVKNRPFYTGDPVETVLVEESTVTFVDNNNGLYLAQLSSTFDATVGEIYKVYWDGTAYECACVYIGDILTIGNPSFIGSGSDTGEPFLISIFSDGRIQILTANTSASHTFSISTTVTPVIKIDPKYLPTPKMTMVSIPAANWTGDTAPYSQVITVNGVTANSKVDLQPTAAQILELQEADIMLMAENDNGTVTIYALGGIPTSDYTMQALITEVEVV